MNVKCRMHAWRHPEATPLCSTRPAQAGATGAIFILHNVHACSTSAQKGKHEAATSLQRLLHDPILQRINPSKSCASDSPIL